MADSNNYWFRAKRYGWGWGLPLCWQGWVALACFMVLLIAGMLLLKPLGMLPFLLYTLGLSAVFTGVCWLTGEPPRWRWGDDDQH